jgi:hypothetical protein
MPSSLSAGRQAGSPILLAALFVGIAEGAMALSKYARQVRPEVIDALERLGAPSDWLEELRKSEPVGDQSFSFPPQFFPWPTFDRFEESVEEWGVRADAVINGFVPNTWRNYRHGSLPTSPKQADLLLTRSSEEGPAKQAGTRVLRIGKFG